MSVSNLPNYSNKKLCLIITWWLLNDKILNEFRSLWDKFQYAQDYFQPNDTNYEVNEMVKVTSQFIHRSVVTLSPIYFDPLSLIYQSI